MTASRNDGDELRLASDGDDELQLSAEEDRASYPVHEYIQAARQPNELRDQPRPKGVKAPFLIGVFEFPFYPDSFLAWVPVTFGLIIAWGVGCLLVAYGGVHPAALFWFGIGTFSALVLSLGYLFACGEKIITDTSAGYDSVGDWPPALAWKDWMWSLVRGLVLATQSALAAAFFTWFFVATPLGPVLGSIPALMLTFVVFPFIVMSALEDDSWGPTSKIVFQSLTKNTVEWLIFYGEAALVALAWVGVTLVSLFLLQFAAGLIVCPLTAIAGMIYARLLGHLAWCIGQKA